ncbi:ParA family protein [Aeromonas aquatica]
MPAKLAIVAQKGGPGKSTITRALGVAYSSAGFKTHLVDLDAGQTSTAKWFERRSLAAAELGRPELIDNLTCSWARTLATAEAAIPASAEIVVYDGAPHATQQTVSLAQSANLVVIPTGISVDDLTPAITLALDLQNNHGIQPATIAMVLNRVGDSDKELEEVAALIREHLPDIHVIAASIPERKAYRSAQDSGFAIQEVTYPSLKQRATSVVEALGELL